MNLMATQSEYRRGEDEDEDEEEIDEFGYKAIKDAVLFAIDISPSMLEAPSHPKDKKADRDSAASAALKCAYQLMQQRIISNPNDMMGILLFGTEKSRFEGEEEEVNSKSGFAYPHCYLLTDLNVPAASDVKKLRTLVNNERQFIELLTPSEERASMANVLFCANQIFTTKAANFSSRRLFLVTDNDNPHSMDKALRSAAAVRAKDMYDLGVAIELFPISRPGHTFDRTKFYDDIVYRPLNDPDAPAPVSVSAKDVRSGDGITLLQSLLSSINSKAMPRRALFSLPLEIGPGFKISIKGYIIIKRQEVARSCYVWLGGEKAQIAIGSTTQIAEDTARTIEKTEIRKAYKFGGETITFTKDEASAIRYFGDPVIRIIGFKPLLKLPLWANFRPPIFIYPSETDYIGSVRTFSALQQKLLKDEKMGLAWFIPRKNAVPSIAAIIPGKEKYGGGGEQKMPPGLWIVPLPFADDIRSNPEMNSIPPSDHLIDMMRTVIQQLQLPKAIYDPHRYPNPALQWFYRILQALALDEDLPEKPEDKTIPRYKQIDKRAGQYVIDWGEALEKEYQRHTAKTKISLALQAKPKSSAIKRPLDGDSSAPSKKVKTKHDKPDDKAMERAYERGLISKMTVAELKGWLMSKHLTVDGKKGELVERINEYWESKGM